jgi:hypothetical protein
MKFERRGNGVGSLLLYIKAEPTFSGKLRVKPKLLQLFIKV